MKSAFLAFLSTAFLSVICGCPSHPPPPPPVSTQGPNANNGPSETAAAHDQPIKGHDGKLPGGGVAAVVGLIHISLFDADATAVHGPDAKIREVHVVAAETRTIALTDVLIGGVSYSLVKRKIDSPWTIMLRDRKHHGIVVTTRTSTDAGQNIIITTENERDFFDVTADPQHHGITTYSLNDQACHGDDKCAEFDSIEIRPANAHSVVYTCGDHEIGTGCGIDIGMLHGRRQ